MKNTHKNAADCAPTKSPAHECLASIAASEIDESVLNPLRILETTSDKSSGTELVHRHEVGRATVYNRIGDLCEWGFLWRTKDGFRITRAGHMAINAYLVTNREIPNETIAYLAKSRHRRTVLETLIENPGTKAELADNNRLPSRSTIHRIIRRCNDYGWITKTKAGTYRTTSDGRCVLDSYRLLAAEFDQLIDKSDLLARLSYWATPPVCAMSSSELVADSNENPHAVLDAAVEAADIRNEGLDHVRSITPLFSPALYDIFRQFIDRDTTFKIIYDQPTYRRLTQPNRIHYLATAIAAPTIEVRIHPDPLYTGVGIYNHDTVMVCGSTRFEKQYGIVSDRGELLTWSNEIFDQLWAESESLSSRLAGWVKQTVATRS